MAAIFVSCHGCGTGEYARRMGESKGARKQLEQRLARINEQLHGASPIAESGISVRIPKVFEKSFNVQSPHPDDGARVNPARLMPPFLQDFPGFFVTYEAFADTSGGKLAYYCYLGSTDASEDVRGKIQQQVNAAMPGARAAWTPFEATAADGTVVSCERLRAEGSQPFAMLGLAQASARTVPGVFEAVVYEADGKIAIMAWRAPKESENEIGLEDLVALSAGTLQSGA